MFFFRKKKKKQAEKTPSWFMWLMGGFIVYALITNLFTDNVAEVQKEAANREIPDMEYFNFAAVNTQGTDGPSRTLFLRDIATGQGPTADCWYSVTADYKLYTNNGELVEDTADNAPIRFVIGQAEVPLALERGALGMRADAKRAVSAHPSMLFGDYRFSHPKMRTDQFGGYILTMKEVKRPENLPLSDLGLRSYEDVSGEGKLAQCTDRVRLRLRGWNANGQPLWKEHNLPAIMVTIGAGKAPYAIERGLIGMRIGGKRTLIVPPGYMKPVFDVGQPPAAEPEEQTAIERAAKELEALTVDNFAWQDLPVPADNVIILELELLPEHIELPDQPYIKP
jgi:FKBP-type peptidyl-prolyl cis-trans isomerase 2